MHTHLLNNPTNRQLIRRLVIVATFPALVLWTLNQTACSRIHALDRAKQSYPSTLSGGAPCGSCIAPASLSWKIVIPPRREPGEPLDISGTIYQPDDVTPAEGIVLFVYHTDVTGYYNEQDDASHPRLKGWMKTGADGRYEFRTIRPGAYPHRSTPAHIHAHLYGPGYSERSIDDFWFEGDPRINPKALSHAREQGSTPVIVAIKRGSDGVWRGVRDIRIKPPPK
jgi:protocatechuate 3,4-dioxygenase beta subunit